MNFKLLIVAVVLGCLSATGFQLPLLDGRIVGGVDTTIDEIPYQVSIEYHNSHWCGGSIINEDTIITAAHCFDVWNFDSFQEVFQVRVNSSYPDVGGVVHGIANIILHEDFNGSLYWYDIALIRLNSTIEYTAGAQPIRMAEINAPIPHGDKALVSGWGRLEYLGPLATILQSVSINVLEAEDCIAVYENINPLTNTMFCAGFWEGGIDSCHGDSGGPLVHNNTLIGLVSWGVACAREQRPGVYTDVGSLRDWVDDNIDLL